MTALLRLEHLTKTFGDLTVIDGVDLKVERSEVVSLIGPNGAGKSTLLRLALGLETADAGKVVRADDLVIGYMPQRIVIDPLFPLSAERFIRLRPGVSRAAARAAAERVGISHRLDSPVAGLSGGRDAARASGPRDCPQTRPSGP